jgi:hypothetical protein
LIFQAIEYNEKFFRREANVRATTEARGWSGLFNGFGGKNSKKISYIEFLPFPEEFKSKYKISKDTAKLLLRLLKSNRIKIKYISLLSEIIEEAVEMLQVGSSK